MSPACERCASPLASVDDDCSSCAVEGLRRGEPWLGRLLASRYRVLRRLGRGASSHVHLVRDLETDENVAMKAMRPDRSSQSDSFDRFMREARVLLRMRHRCIVDVRDVGELTNGYVFLTMEFVEGESLQDVLRRGPVPPLEALSIAQQVAEALVVVHGEGVVHRDLKPSNVLLTETAGPARAVKLVDFGIASLSHAISITGTGQRLGTPGYMAPEYLRSGNECANSDQYSLGVILYEMLSLRMPFEATSHGRLLLKQTSEAPTPLSVRIPSTRADLDAVVMRSIAPDPADRYADCAAFSRAIADVRRAIESPSDSGASA